MPTIERDDTARINKPGHEYHGRQVVVEDVFHGNAHRTSFVAVSITTGRYRGGGYSGHTIQFEVGLGEAVLVRKGNADQDTCDALFAKLDAAKASR
jgi:hypothetical protein